MLTLLESADVPVQIGHELPDQHHQSSISACPYPLFIDMKLSLLHPRRSAIGIITKSFSLHRAGYSTGVLITLAGFAATAIAAPRAGVSSLTATSASSSASASASATGGLCYAAFDNCKAQPQANNAQCVADLASCLGYNPFARSTTTTTTSASASASATGGLCYAAFDNCKAQPQANNAQCVADLASCLGYNPFARSTTTTTTSASASASATGGLCYAAFDNCKAQPQANNAQCVADLAGCLGYNPFAQSNTASSTSVSASPSPTGKGNSTEMACYNGFNKCKAQPDPNNAQCVAELAGCLGYNPFAQPTTSSPAEHATTTTVIVSSFTTYCPEPTTISWGTKTYTVTSATTLTITDCPCTITKPWKPTSPVILPPTTTPCTTSTTLSTTPCTTSSVVPPVQKPPVYTNTTTPCTTSATTAPPPPPANTNTTTPCPPSATPAPPPPAPTTSAPAPAPPAPAPPAPSSPAPPAAPPAPSSSAPPAAPPAPSTTAPVAAPPAPSVTTPTTTRPASSTSSVVTFTGAAVAVSKNGGAFAAALMGAVAFLV
ncbi:hypothetical protein KVT40_005360 [Elsinoe batatas]|uniref:Uncharacterized protein n=1 Tax=Elsinoe batatas TaxID=2601811 RepID=A0A8K0PC20_9PEZI|nr:hypothetical protein KVT40_005360 [Elsinoe batatas]